MELKTEIEIMTPKRMAYLRKTGAYGRTEDESKGNKPLMEKLKTWAKENGLFTQEAVIIGVAQDNPEIVPDEECRYDVGILISDDFVVTGEVKESQTTGGRYLVITIPHTAEAVQDGWSKIFMILKGENKQLDVSRPIIERYQNQLVNKGYCEICVPIL